MVRHGERPNPSLAPDWSEKVLHARIEIGAAVIMGADVPHAEPMRSAYLTLSLDQEADAERLYSVLADGEIFMKMERTPFANRFAMLRDRFRDVLDAPAPARSDGLNASSSHWATAGSWTRAWSRRSSAKVATNARLR